MNPSTLLIINGHPNGTASLCGALAQGYYEGALASGRRVELLTLSDLTFAPNLKGYGSDTPLEPDLVRAQTLIREATHLVFVYPNWWGSMPGLLKAFIDRTFLPGFAFSYRGKDSLLWDKLLVGKTARLLVTMDTPPWYYRLIYKAVGDRLMRHNILGFCGINPVKSTLFGPVKLSRPEQRTAWIERCRSLGQRGG
jgi:NAD(P)H dehydrogenase (quinone)